MVDCGSPRCAQERRSIRRDLQCWSKKLSVVLGLERIAADFVDEDTAKQLLDPFSEWQKDIKQDFQPCSKCFHCEKKLPNIYKRIKRTIEDAKRGKENSGKVCLRSLQDLMPFCLDFYTRGFGRELFSDVVKSHFLTAGPQTDDPDPQDLTTATDLAKLRIPHLVVGRSSKKIDNRLNYTESDLELAVADIKRGKFGTRRAAMIYGIPRSTLRSKMMKEERDVPEESILDQNIGDLYQTVHSSSPLTGLKVSDLGIFGMCESMMAFCPPLNFSVDMGLKHKVNEFLTEQRLSHIRRMHNLNGLSHATPRPAHANQLRLPLLVNVVRKLVQQKLIEIKENFGRKNSQCSPDTELLNPFSSYLPAFSPFLTSGNNDENLASPMYKHLMESLYTNMIKEEHSLPKPFGKVNECSRIGDTLKDIIAKTLSEKIKFRDGSSDESSLQSNPDTFKHFSGKLPEHLRYSSDVSKKDVGTCSPPKRAKKDCGKSVGASTLDPSTGKKTRPKRGQYRKYNSQLLMDAVKAVQRGEMSVHRAGSFFGVPHSTLEYKVKERHLLRQKKSRDFQSTASKEEVTPSLTSFSSQSNGSPALDEDSCAKTPPSSQTPTTKSVSPPSSSPVPHSALGLSLASKDSLTWFQPYMTTSSNPLNSVLNLHSNNSASELLIQLQHKVQAKCSRAFPSDSAFDLPCKDRVFDLSSASGSGSSDHLALFKQSI